jgi:hypothetical protein
MRRCAHAVTLIDVDNHRVRRYVTEAFEDKKFDKIDAEALQVAESVRHKVAAMQAPKEDHEGTPRSRSDSISSSASSYVSPNLMSHQLSGYSASTPTRGLGAHLASPHLQPVETNEEAFLGKTADQAENEDDLKDIAGAFFNLYLNSMVLPQSLFPQTLNCLLNSSSRCCIACYRLLRFFGKQCCSKACAF